MRKLASIRRIADIQPIEGADAIEHFCINGCSIGLAHIKLTISTMVFDRKTKG